MRSDSPNKGWFVTALCVASISLCCIGNATAGPTSTVHLAVDLGHRGEVKSVAFSPDGRLVLTGGEDQTARIWDLATGHEIHQVKLGGHGLIYAVAFDLPHARLFAGGSDPTVGLWSIRTGEQIRRFDLGAKDDSVVDIVLSPDGNWALTGEVYRVRLWNVQTSHEVRRFNGCGAGIFSHSGRWLLLTDCDDGDSAVLRDVASNRELGRFKEDGLMDRPAVFSPDDRRIFTVDQKSADEELPASVLIWDVATHRQIGELTGHTAEIKSIAISPDGRHLLTGSADSTGRIWDLATKRELHQLRGHHDKVNSVSFSPDGKYALTGSADNTAILWNAASGHALRYFGGKTDEVTALAVSADGRRLVTATSGSVANIWDLTQGRQIQRLIGHTGIISSVALSGDARLVLTGASDETARLWDVESGRELKRLAAGPDLAAVALSPDGRFALTGFVKALLWDLKNGTQKELDTGDGRILAMAFSPDGQLALTGGQGPNARLWEVPSGRQLRQFKSKGTWVSDVGFKDREAVVANSDNSLHVWDIATGNEVNHVDGPHVLPPAIETARKGNMITGLVTISPDRQWAFIDPWINSSRVWDVGTGKQVLQLDGIDAGGWNQGVGFSSGRWLFLGNADGITRVYDLGLGRLALTLVSFTDGGWAVVDPEGRYDASDPDSSPGLYWVLEDQVIELKQLKDRFYAPGLLARTLGFNKESLPAVAGLDHLQLWPTAELIPPKRGDTKATIKLTNRGGGIGYVVVKVNGREIPLNVRKAGINPNAKTADIEVDLTPATLAADGNNEIEVAAYDRTNLVSGRGFKVAWKKGPEKPVTSPTLHAIIAGVSTFENSKLNLHFPAKDALDMAKALQVGGAHLFGVDHVDVQVFASGTENEPTKENIARGFKQVAMAAGPDDVVLVYFAGHGLAGKAGSDSYYFLTREARSLEPGSDVTLQAATTISSNELLEWLRTKGMPLRQVVVLDTCAAGQAATELIKLADRRELSADQRRAIELLKDRTGSHILMGAAADAVSYEATRYGQGLLTYALLSGMRGEALDEGGRLEVRKWFDTAEHRVPELAQGIGGIQKPVVSSPGGQSFPIALLTQGDFAKIPLAQVKPQLLRVICQDDDDSDPLRLEPALRAELRAASTPMTRGSEGREPALVYLDEVVGDVADAYTTRVHYWIEGDNVRLRLRLQAGDRRLEKTIEAATHDPSSFATAIREQFVAMLASAGK